MRGLGIRTASFTVVFGFFAGWLALEGAFASSIGRPNHRVVASRSAPSFVALPEKEQELRTATWRTWKILGEESTRTPRIISAVGSNGGFKILEIHELSDSSEVVTRTKAFLSEKKYRSVLNLPALHQNGTGDSLRVIPDRLRDLDAGRLWIVDFQQYRDEYPILGATVSLWIRGGYLVHIQSNLYAEELCGSSCPLPKQKKEQEDEEGEQEEQRNPSLFLYVDRVENGSTKLRLAEQIPVKERLVPGKNLHWKWRQSEAHDLPPTGVLYRDAETKEPIAGYSKIRDLTGTLRGLVYERGPVDEHGEAAELVDMPMPDVSVKSRSEKEFKKTTDAKGNFVVPGNESIQFLFAGVQTKTHRCRYKKNVHQPDSCDIPPRFWVTNSKALSLNPLNILLVGRSTEDVASTIYSERTVPDAERNLFYHLNYARNEIKRIAPFLRTAWLETPVTARIHETYAVKNVNRSFSMGGACAAEFDASKPTPELNFYTEGAVIMDGDSYACNNTAEVADVIYHEWAHGIYFDLIGRDFSREDPATNEAAADIVAFHLTNSEADRDNPHDDSSSRIGLGMFKGPEFPNGKNWMRDVKERRVFPRDLPRFDDPHEESQIFSGAMWDLRKSLLNKPRRSGEEIGNDLSLKLFLRALKVTQTYTEFYDALRVVDHTFYGGEHEQLIWEAFNAHGLVP